MLLAAGEGLPQHRAHAESCMSCAERYQRFVHTLTVIEQTLRETSPPANLPHLPTVSRWQWLPLTAALAAVILLIWSGLWLRSPHPQSALIASPNQEEVEQFWENVLSPALFAEPDTRIFVAQSPPSNTMYLQAALDGGWPCEWQESAALPSCAVHPFPFVFDEQRQEVYYVSAD
jgi:hypothetical protein